MTSDMKYDSRPICCYSCTYLTRVLAYTRHMFFGGPKPSLFSKKDKEDQEENLLGEDMNFKKENNLSKTWEAIQKFEDAPPQSLEETISNMTDSDEQSPYEDLKDDEVKENRNSDLTKEEIQRFDDDLDNFANALENQDPVKKLQVMEENFDQYIDDFTEEEEDDDDEVEQQEKYTD